MSDLVNELLEAWIVSCKQGGPVLKMAVEKSMILHVIMKYLKEEVLKIDIPGSV